MNIENLFPEGGKPQRLYCDECNTSMDLSYADFSEEIASIQIDIYGFPYLYCHKCDKYYLTDRGRISLLKLHEEALKNGSDHVNVGRRKIEAKFRFSKIPFLVDADDYYYLPGLYRSHDDGFLTPLFFNKEVLLKFDNSPNYRVSFASQSYGTIYTEEKYISFGINRHGKVIMWLGDVATLPESEQYYLRSENVESDHSIGSEFYDGQIECIFTEPPQEKLAISARSALGAVFQERFKAKLYHLDSELIETIAGLAPPLVDTEKERKHIFDSLNRIFVEAIDNASLENIMRHIGISAKGSGSLKRLQAVLESISSPGSAATALLPFYVLYDLRIAYSHLTSTERRAEILASAEYRLELAPSAVLAEFYDVLVKRLIRSLEIIINLLNEKEERVGTF